MARLKRERPAQIAMQWVTLLLSVVVLSIGLVMVVAAPAEAEQFATLHPLEGSVEVAEDGGVFRPGREGQVLGAGDTVRTGADGRAEIEYFEGSVTRLENQTVFALEELSTNTEVPGSKTILAEQEHGRTFERVVAITDSESRFEVGTPTATASVRGTTYVLNRLPDGTVILWVLPDDDPELGEVVLVLDDGTEIVVTEGQGAIAFPDGTAGVPFDLTDEQLSDAWVLYNLCEIDALPVEACEIEDVFEPIDPLDPEEPEEPEEPEVLGETEEPREPGDDDPSPTPPAPASFSSGDGGSSTSSSGGGPRDTSPPKTTITEAPDDPTRSRSAAFRFRANEPVRYFECSLDGGSYSRCNSGRTYTGLGDGTHQFRVRATDRAGNRENTATHSWTIDNDPPEIESIEDNCDARLGCNPENTRIDFTANEAGVTYDCRLEAEEGAGRGSEAPCSPPVVYDDLEPCTTYTFSVRATDAAGNEGPEESHSLFTECVFAESPARGGDAPPRGTAAEVTPPTAVDAQDVVSAIDGVVQGVADTVTGAIGDASDLVEDVDDVKDELLEDPRLGDAPNLLP